MKWDSMCLVSQISDSILVTEIVLTQLLTQLVTELVTQSPGREARAAPLFAKFTIFKALSSLFSDFMVLLCNTRVTNSILIN